MKEIYEYIWDTITAIGNKCLTSFATSSCLLTSDVADFSTAMQLHDFTDLQSFPSRLRSLTICLSENIFLEGFLRKVYTFISSMEVLQIIGKYSITTLKIKMKFLIKGSYLFKKKEVLQAHMKKLKMRRRRYMKR